MFNKDLECLLNILTVTIFADSRIFSEEIETFVSCALWLAPTHGLEPMLSEAKLISWYEQNKGNIKQKLESSDFENWINYQFDCLKSFPGKKAVLLAMKQISQSDGNCHISEKALIVLASRRWNVPLAQLAA